MNTVETNVKQMIIFHFSYFNHGEYQKLFLKRVIAVSPSSKTTRSFEDLFASKIIDYAFSSAENLEGKTPMDISKGLSHTESIELVRFVQFFRSLSSIC